MAKIDATLYGLMKAIAVGDSDEVRDKLKASPELVRARIQVTARGHEAAKYFLSEITTHIYSGDTLLHTASGAYNVDLVKALIVAGADVNASNRRGATPLHNAAMGLPGSPAWNPKRQAAVIARLIAAGADPNALDDGGVAPLHRAVRTRCSAAVKALLEAGARAGLKSKSGSTPMDLAVKFTGRGGSGSPEAKAEQVKIIRLLEAHAGLAS